jgi:hypothetical protein
MGTFVEKLKNARLALWSAQREVYDDGLRRPYVATGVYPQRLRIRRQDVIGRMMARLSGALAGWQKARSAVDPNDRARMRTVLENIAYYDKELAHFRELAKERRGDWS